MYLQDWVEDPDILPAEGHEGEPTRFVPHILRRLDVAGQGQEVPEYFADDMQPQLGNHPDPRRRLPEEDRAVDS